MKKRMAFLSVLLLASIGCLTFAGVAYAEGVAGGSSPAGAGGAAAASLSYAARLARDIDAHRVPRLGDLPYIDQAADDTAAPDYTIDDSVPYVYDPVFSTRSGRWTESGGAYTSGATNSLAVDTSTPFRYGTFSCHIKTDPLSDNGLVFCFSGEGTWETGNRYYFYFLDKSGGLYLGKVDNGWKYIDRVAVPSLSASATHELKVVLQGYKILCYLDDELMFYYRDDDLLPGAGYGIRAGGANVAYSDIQVTSEYIFGSDE